MDEQAGAQGTVAAGEPGAPPSRTRRAVRRTLTWVIALGLALWLARKIDLRDLPRSLAMAPWWSWALAAAGLCCSYLFRGLRIHAELSRRHPVTRLQCLRVMVLHNTAVNLVPMRGGEAAYPILVNRQLGIPTGQGVASLVWIRSQDMLVLGLIAVSFVPWLPPWARALLVLVVLGLVLALIAVLQVFVARRGAAPAPENKLLRTGLAALQALSDAPRHGVAGWLYGTGSWLVKLASLGFLLSRLTGLAPIDGMAGAVGGELAGILPIQGPAGFGTYEAGVWAGASLHGHAALPSPAPIVAIHLLALATALASGAIAYALSPRGAAAQPPEHRHD